MRRRVEGVHKAINGYIADFMEYFYEPIVSTHIAVIQFLLSPITNALNLYT